MKRSKNKNKARIKKSKIPGVLITLGIFLMGISFTYWTLRFRALSLDKELLAQHQAVQVEDNRPAKPKHIFIEWFVDIPIEVQVLQDNRWTISEQQASYLDQSARPGEAGNIIIYGHNKRRIMGNIRVLKGGEEVTITTEDGIKHAYVVNKIVEVSPDQTEFLKPTSEETLTLYTCSGFMDKQRFIVQAKPKQI